MKKFCALKLLHIPDMDYTTEKESITSCVTKKFRCISLVPTCIKKVQEAKIKTILQMIDFSLLSAIHRDENSNH